jgi:hypothetical protein
MSELMVVPAMMPTRSRVARKGKQTPYFFSVSKLISKGWVNASTLLTTELKLVILLLPFFVLKILYQIKVPWKQGSSFILKMHKINRLS